MFQKGKTKAQTLLKPALSMWSKQMMCGPLQLTRVSVCQWGWMNEWKEVYRRRERAKKVNENMGEQARPMEVYGNWLVQRRGVNKREEIGLVEGIRKNCVYREWVGGGIKEERDWEQEIWTLKEGQWHIGAEREGNRSVVRGSGCCTGTHE